MRNQEWTFKILFESTKSSDQKVENDLDQNLLDGILKFLNLGLELRAFLGNDGAGDNRAGDTAGAAEGSLGLDENVGNVFVLAQQGQMQQDFKGLGVGSQDDDFGDTAIEGLGGFVRALLELLVVGGLLNEFDLFTKI